LYTSNMEVWKFWLSELTVKQLSVITIGLKGMRLESEAVLLKDNTRLSCRYQQKIIEKDIEMIIKMF